MYKKEKPLSLKGSTSALSNNLSVHNSQEKGVINYAVVHKAVVNVVGVSTDGTSFNHRQVVCKEPTSTHGATIVIQARLLSMANRTLLVIASQMGIQMFEADGSLMLYWYALGDVSHAENETCFGRGICGMNNDTVCVGTHEGTILVFDIPSRGSNITLSSTLTGHGAAICDLEAEGSQLVSSDDRGNIIVWHATGDTFKQSVKISGSGYPASSLGLWNDLIVCGYASGHLRVFNSSTGKMAIEASAHGRWITAVDVSQNGLVLSASEDSYVRVWQLRSGSKPDLEHIFSECVTDLQLQGAQFTSPDGKSFAVTGYDSPELTLFSQK